MDNKKITFVMQAMMDISNIKSQTSEIQTFLNKLKLPENMKGSFTNIFSSMEKELTNFQNRLNSGFKNKGDITGLEKEVGKISGLFDNLNAEIAKIDDSHLRKSLNLDTTQIQEAKKRIQELNQELSEKMNAAGLKDVQRTLEQMGTKTQFKTKFAEAFASGDIKAAGAALSGLVSNLQSFGGASNQARQKIDGVKVNIEAFNKALRTGDMAKAKTELDKITGALQGVGSTNLQSTINGLQTLFTKFQGLQNVDVSTIRSELERLGLEVADLTNDELQKLISQFGQIKGQGQSVANNFRGVGDAAVAAGRGVQQMNNELDQIKSRVQYFFSLTNGAMLFRRALQQAFTTVKELDAAMAETAVVTDFEIGDMWKQLPQYTVMAKELGVTTLGVYEASTLYYQQGLKQNEVMQLTEETLKMARIAGMDYANATDLMTAALRGFNMELNDASATRINDVYSKLAAITAADTKEIATAMTKTASIASSANMEFETTAALLSQIIETTREPAETAGTAMKTIIARFTEMKKATTDIINVDGEEVSVNKVEQALKSAGVALRDASGEFRDLDDVFLELSSRWNSLDLMTQRYIATTAAGSRQQSRFIAMMQNYDRTVELVGAAYDSAGASATQFGKTQDSLETAINKLKDTWNNFLMGIANSEAIKAFINVLTQLLSTLDSATTGVGGMTSFILKMFTVIGGLQLGKGFFNKIIGNIGAQFLSGGQKAAQDFNSGFNSVLSGGFKGVAQKAADTIAKPFRSLAKLPQQIQLNKAFNNVIKDINASGKNLDSSGFAEKLKSMLDPSLIKAQAPQIASVLESSLQSALGTSNLSDEGMNWAKGLIDTFIKTLNDSNGDIIAATKQLEQSVASGLMSDKAADYFENGEEGAHDARKNLPPQTDSNGDSSSPISINKETVANAKQTELNLMGWGMALTGASMALNAVTSGLEKSGALSEDAAKMIDGLSSGLSTTGSMLMMVNGVQKMFNITTAANPYIAIAAVIIGVITTVANLIGQANEHQKELNKSTMETAKTSGKEAKEMMDSVKSYEEMVETYKETGEETEELIAAKEELIELMDLEKYGVNALTSSYEEVAAAAREAAKAELEAANASQKAGLQSGISQIHTDGKFTAGDAGFTGQSTFELDTTSADYQTQLDLFKEVAKELGIEGLTYSQDGLNNNLQIGNIGISDEEQYQFMKLLSEVLSRMVPETEGYEGLQELWGRIGEYYSSTVDIMNNKEDLGIQAATYAAEDYLATSQEQSVTSMEEFHNAVNNITGHLKDLYPDLNEIQLQKIANDTLISKDNSLSKMGQAYTQLLKMAGQEGFEEFLAGLSHQEIELIVSAEVVIDENSLITDIGAALDENIVLDSLFGSTHRMKNVLVPYAQKLANGEEITEEDKQAMTEYFARDFDIVDQKQWEILQDAPVSTQLDFLNKKAQEKKAESDAARQTYMDKFDEAVVEDMKYFEAGANGEQSNYEQDKADVITGKNLISRIERVAGTEEEAPEEVSDSFIEEVTDFSKKHGFAGVWNAGEHLTEYNYHLNKSKDAYQIYSEDVIKEAENQAGLIEESDAGQKKFDEGMYTLNPFKIAAGAIEKGVAQAGIILSDASLADQTGEGMIEAMKKSPEDYANANATQQQTDINNAILAITEAKNEIQRNVTAIEERINTKEQTAAYVLHQAGFTSEGIAQDRTGDQKTDFYDVQDLIGELKSAFSLLSSDGMEGINTDQAFNDDGSINTSLEGVTDQNTLTWINQIKEWEDKGIKIETSVNDEGIRTATVTLEKFDEKGNKIEKDPIEITITGQDKIDEFAKQINDLDGTLVEIEVEIKQANFDAAASAFDSAAAQAQNFANALSLINSDMTVTPENARKLQQIFPQLLDGATAVGDKIKLSKSTYDEIANQIKTGLTGALTDYEAAAEDTVDTTKKQAQAYQDFYANKTAACREDAKAYVESVLQQEQAAAQQAETEEKQTNLGIKSASALSIAKTTSLSEINEAVKTGTQNWVYYHQAAAGNLSAVPDMGDITASDGTSAAYKEFVDTTTWVTADDVINYLEGTDPADKNGSGSNEDEIAAVSGWADLINTKATTETSTDTKTDFEIDEAWANSLLNTIGLGPSADLNGNGGGGSSNSSKLEKESDKLKSKIDEIDSAIKDLADNDIVDMRMVNQLISQKIALQKEYKKALEKELIMLSASTDEIWSQVKKEGNDKYIEYSDETGGYQYTDAYYDDFFKDGIPIDSEQMQKVQEQMNQLNQANSDQLSNQIAIKELVDNLVQNQAENYNAERSLKGRERRQTEADAEEELIGMLPEEIQPFFQALNTAEDARLEMQEIQANKVLAENLQQQLDASYAGVPDYIKENMTFDEYSGYGIDLAKINQIEDKEAREEMLTAVQENAKILNEQYFDPLYDVKEQLSGGKLQKGILTTAKALKDFAKEVSDNDFNDGLLKVETGFKALDEALNGLIERIENSELVDEFLNKKAIGGLGLGDKERDTLLSNEKLVEFLGKSGLGPIVSEIGWGEGATNGELLSLANGFMGGALEQIGGFLNFDMMKILDDSGGLIEQGKQMVEQIIGKVAEVTGALIDAWTNREDILYNFLNVLERYLHDYEVMQRYSTQLEKGRMASVDDIRQNWEQQWQSLQDQLEMQQERIETRQDQLDRSRWNPFQLISGWDPTSDSLYENRGVKMAFDLLISAIGMLPMGLGAFGGQLNQLYEDYDKRVQEAYEDRLAAEMAILDIEDERLELVKIGAEEATEFEQKVLDALVQKEQEQIEELSRLNDAITNANSKLISTLQKNLDQIRQDRENEKKEEELGEKERRLAYLRQDTSGANMMEIKKLEEELEEGHEDYTDTLIDQKISELEKQNEAAAEQRQQQIDLLQAQLDWSQKYGLYWDAIYGMLYTIDENGNAVLNPENFDLDGNIRENSQLAQMLGTFSDRLGMSVWSSVLDNEEAKRLGRYYGAFIGNNGVSGEWADYWALLNPGADDPDYATPMPEIPDGIWGVLYRIETSIGKYFGSSNMGLWNTGERLEVGLKNILGDVFNIEEWANATAKGFHREDVIGKNTLTLMNGWNKLSEGLLGIADFGNKTSQSLTNRAGYNRHQNNGDNNISNYFNIGTVGENISLDDMVDKVSSALREVFSAGTNIVHHGR